MGPALRAIWQPPGTSSLCSHLGADRVAHVEPGTARLDLAFISCHYPQVFHAPLRISNPSHIHMRRCQPRQIVCQPGIPSCLRARKPPSRAVVTSTLRLLQPPLGRPNLFSRIANASEPKLSLASKPS